MDNSKDISDAKAAYKDYLAHQAEHATPEDNRSFGRKALDYGARTAGFLGGVSRAGLAETVNAFLPADKDITREDDLKRMLKGEAPITAEYLERAGMPKIISASDVIPGYAEKGQGGMFTPEKGGALDPSLRGAIGMVGDIVTDPLTGIGGSLSTIAKSGARLSPLERGLYTALNPIEAYSGHSAKINYAKAFNAVDKKFPDKPHAVSDILRENNFVGSANDAADKLTEINAQAGKNVGGVLNEAAAKGANVNVADSMESAWNYAEELKKHGTPEANKLAADIQGRIQQLWDAHPNGIPANQANEIKSNLNSFINFNPGEQEAISNQSRKAVAGGLSQGVKTAVGSSDEELLNRLLEQNAMYSSTSPQVQKKMIQYGNQVANQRGPLGLTGVDAIIGGGAAVTPAALPMLGVKKLMNIGQSVEGRTARGAMMNKVYKSSLPIDASARNIWEEMNNKGAENETQR